MHMIPRLSDNATKSQIVKYINELNDAVKGISNLRVIGGGAVTQTKFGTTINVKGAGGNAAANEDQRSLVFQIVLNETAGGWYLCDWQRYDDSDRNTQNTGSFYDRAKFKTGATNFIDNGTAKHTITITSGDLTAIFCAGMNVVVTASASNNNTFAIDAVSEKTLTLHEDATLTTEVDDSATLTVEAICLNIAEVPISGDLTSHKLAAGDLLEVFSLTGDDEYKTLMARELLRYHDCT